MLKKIAIGMFLIFSGFVLWDGINPKPSTQPAPSVRDPFKELGYFKDDGRNRIFTISYAPGASRDAMRKYASNLPYTERRMTAAYFYPEGSVIPRDGITLAPSIFDANRVLYEMKGLSAWTAVYMRGLNGVERFIDCQSKPSDGLCRR